MVTKTKVASIIAIYVVLVFKALVRAVAILIQLGQHIAVIVVLYFDNTMENKFKTPTFHLSFEVLYIIEFLHLSKGSKEEFEPSIKIIKACFWIGKPSQIWFPIPFLGEDVDYDKLIAIYR